MCRPNCLLLWSIHLLYPIVFVLFGIWMINFNNDFNDYESQCDTPANVNYAIDSNCPSGWGTDAGCDCIYINETCEITTNITNCIGYGYSCECDSSIQPEIVMSVIGYTILADIIFFEFIKALILFRICCILSAMKNQPNARHDARCLRCGIATIGNSYFLQCIMCTNPGKSVVKYMYHRGMLLKNCGCCCIFFWQTLFAGALIFFYGYAMMIGLVINMNLGSPTLFYVTLICNCVWILLQFLYCVGPLYTDDEAVQLEVGKYNLPFVTDLRPSAAVGSGSPIQYGAPVIVQQQVPLQVIQPQMVQPQAQMVYMQQTMANGQVVYRPVQQPAQQQVIMVPQPQPIHPVASASIGGNDYQIINPSVPSAPLGPGGMDDANVPPPAMNPEYNASAPPPSYNAFMDGNEVGSGQAEGGVTVM